MAGLSINSVLIVELASAILNWVIVRFVELFDRRSFKVVASRFLEQRWLESVGALSLFSQLFTARFAAIKVNDAGRFGLNSELRCTLL